MEDYSKILVANFPNAQWQLNDNSYETLQWFSDTPKPTQAELDALWIPTQEADSKAANKATASGLLSATDWTTIADIGLPTANPRLSNQDQFIAYRQVIRQIAVYPTAGEVVWPTPPTEVWEGE
jgi:hypothetical protein